MPFDSKIMTQSQEDELFERIAAKYEHQTPIPIDIVYEEVEPTGIGREVEPTGIGRPTKMSSCASQQIKSNASAKLVYMSTRTSDKKRKENEILK